MDKALKIALVLSAVDKMSAIVNKAVSKSTRAIQGFNAFGNTAGLIGGAITGVFGKSVADARESEIANKRLEQVFKSMGDTQGIAAKKAEEYAAQLQMQIGIEDEVILLTQSKLATFKKVSDEAARMSGVFDRATKAAFDMAAAGFGEADQNAVQLGKALQDPITGINALRRSGITFTEAEKKKIATLVRTNKTLDAQKIILAAVEQQVGGVAAATADPLARMHVAWSEVSEQLGKILLPYLQKFATWISTFVPKVQTWIAANGKLVKAIAAVGTALLLIGTISKVVSAIMATNPIVLIIMAIAAVAVLLITYWKPVKDFFIRLWNGIKSIFSSVWNWIKNLFMNYTPGGLIIKNWSKISAFFKNIWNAVKRTFSAVWQWIKGLVMKYTPFGLIIKYWQPISNFFSNIWEKVKNVFVAAWNWLKGLGKMFWDAGKNIIMSIWNGIKAMVNKPIELIKSMVKKIRDYLPFSPAKMGALRDIHKIKLVETIAATIKPQPALAAMKKTTQSISDFRGGNNQRLQPLAVRNGGHTISITQHFNGNVSSADLNKSNKELKESVLKIMRDEDKRRQRVSYSG